MRRTASSRTTWARDAALTTSPSPHRIDADTTVRPLAPADAAAVYALLTASRGHLDQWLRWSAGVRTLDDVHALIDRFAARMAAGDGFHCGIWSRGELAGGVICWYLNRDNRNAELGYWLGEGFTGRGLATRATRWAVTHLFETERVHRVEMQCGVANVRSRAVAERLGFVAEGIRRESHWITDRFVDHVIYGLLAPEWRQGHAAG